MTESLASSNVSFFLDSYLSHDADAAWYRKPDIPAKKLKNAVAKYGNNVPSDSVLALGDGTIFGSAKEGILITEDTLFSRTSDGTFSVPLGNISSVKVLGGWPGHNVELQCRDGSTQKISTTCFDKKKDALVAFLQSVADATEQNEPEQNEPEQNEPEQNETRQQPRRAQMAETPITHQSPTTFDTVTLHKATSDKTTSDTASSNRAAFADTSAGTVDSGLNRISLCEFIDDDDANDMFEMAFQSDSEWPLLSGYCRYVGFNAREVDGVFLLSNQRLLVFSMESGAKIVVVETTSRLLDKLPVPFLDSIVCFFVFSIPRSIYVWLRGGKEKLIAQALEIEKDQLLSEKPPLRKVQDFTFSQLKEHVARVDIGTGVWTGILSREFGVSFSPSALSKSLSVPKDVILSEYETLEPIERLLHALRPTLAKWGLEYQSSDAGQKLSIVPAAANEKAAA